MNHHESPSDTQFEEVIEGIVGAVTPEQVDATFDEVIGAIRAEDRHRLLKPMEFFVNPEPSTVGKDTRTYLQSDEYELFCRQQDLRAGQDWSYLSDKMVGAEEPMNERHN